MFFSSEKFSCAQPVNQNQPSKYFMLVLIGAVPNPIVALVYDSVST